MDYNKIMANKWTYSDKNPIVHTLAHWMVEVDYVAANETGVHLQTSDLMVAFENSMFDRNLKDRPFCLYDLAKVF
jgi:hypothetical protein